MTSLVSSPALVRSFEPRWKGSFMARRRSRVVAPIKVLEVFALGKIRERVATFQQP